MNVGSFMRKEENKGKSLVRALVLVLTATLLLSSMMLFVPKATASPISWGIESPYLNLANDHKVALHTHTTESDGTLTPTESMEAYKAYGFVAQAITDHNMVTADPSVADIIYITSDEYSPATGHFTGINITSHFTGTDQQTIDNTTAQGGLTFIAHPNVSPATIGWTEAEVDAVSGYLGIEIFNGYTGDSQCFAEDIADYVTDTNTNVLYVAVDDSHTAETIYRGWVEVNTDIAAGALTADDIVTILASGNYLSMGRLSNAYPSPAQLDITVSGKTISITASTTATIEFISTNGVEQTNTSTTSAVYTADDWNDKYIRVKATVGTGGSVSYTYSNPLAYASTPYDFVGAVHVFTGAADADASNNANWNIVGAWTTHLAPPTDANVVFNATSTNKPCTWDLDDSFGTFYINSDYTGTITQTSNFTCANFLIGGGVLTGSITKWLNCSGDFIVNTTATITTSLLRLSMSGSGATVHVEKDGVTLHSLQITGTTSIKYSAALYLRVLDEMTITGTCIVESGFTLRFYGRDVFTNTGGINGEGSFDFVLISGGPTSYTWTPGVINTPVQLSIDTVIASSSFTLGADAAFGSSLWVYSNHATNTCTLTHGSNYKLTVAGTMTLGTRALAVQGTGTWTFGSYIQDGVSSSFTQAGEIACGDWNVSNGAVIGSVTKWLTVSGDVYVDNPATITTSLLRLSMSGSDKTAYFKPAVTLHSLEISGSVTLQYSTALYLRVLDEMTITGTCIVESGFMLRFYGRDVFTNTGEIDGLGAFEFVLISGGPTSYTWEPGIVKTPVQVAIGASMASSTFTLGDNVTFGASFLVYSNHATNTCTFSMVNKSISATNITVAARGILNATTSIIGCSGDWDSANGTFDTNGTQVIMYEGDTYAKLASGDWFDELMLANESIRLIFDTETTVSFLTHSAHIVVQPSAFVTMVAEYPASDVRVAWEIITDADTLITYTISGLPYDSGYRCYQDDLVVIYGFGPGFEFSTIGGGEFEIVYWYERQISAIVVLTVNMIGLGMIVTVLASYIAPIARDIKEKRPVRPEKLTQNLIRTVIFIVVASLMWGVLHSIAIG